jgi:hypothetical protein
MSLVTRGRALIAVAALVVLATFTWEVPRRRRHPQTVECA